MDPYNDTAASAPYQDDPEAAAPGVAPEAEVAMSDDAFRATVAGRNGTTYDLHLADAASEAWDKFAASPWGAMAAAPVVIALVSAAVGGGGLFADPGALRSAHFLF